MKSIAVFLDRDGTICKDVHYMRSPEQFELLPGAAEGIRRLNELGVKVIVATNQSGIARGYFTHETLQRIHERMIEELSRRGARIDGIYYCPHHPDEGCSCRKPKIGLLERAAADFNLDLRKCFVVGDRKLDLDTAKNAGCVGILVRGPETEEGLQAQYEVKDLLEAAELIKSLMSS
jgi:D-glycero-D-manno-heptose 1,7-bisphosphate phosphatase